MSCANWACVKHQKRLYLLSTLDIEWREIQFSNTIAYLITSRYHYLPSYSTKLMVFLSVLLQEKDYIMSNDERRVASMKYDASHYERSAVRIDPTERSKVSGEVQVKVVPCASHAHLMSSGEQSVSLLISYPPFVSLVWE